MKTESHPINPSHTTTPHCADCTTPYNPARAALGIPYCMPCGEKRSEEVVRTVVPMHKSNYVLVTDLTLLPMLTRPGRTLTG